MMMPRLVLPATMMCLAVTQAVADTSSSINSASGVPVSELVAIVAHKTGKKFVIDPRVRAEVAIVGQDKSALSYTDLLTVLGVHGFIAVEEGGYVLVLPDANARQRAVPTISDRDSRSAAEIVSVVFFPKYVPATQLVPILRPLMPQYGHLAAFPCTNGMIMTDTFANVRRLQGIARALDVGAVPYTPPACDAAEKVE
jgi:type II secretory pathway component GspD/PulD (secretin)